VSKDLAPRGRGTPTERTSGVISSPGQPGELCTRSSGQLSYIPSEIIGFDHVPEHVAMQLRRENIIAGAGVASWADRPVTKRRTDRSTYQVIAAWWADCTRLVILEVRRDLEEIGNGKFRPTGAWVPGGTVYQFPPGISAVSYSSTPEPGGSGKDSDGATVIAESPVDVLPEYLQPALRGGMAGAVLHTRRKWARETVVAQRLNAGRVLVLRAEREAKSQQSLVRATWAVTSIDSPVAGSWRIGPARDSSPAIGMRHQAPAIEAPRTYW
jgi:hypothetical protein